EERRGSALSQGGKSYLGRYPNTQYVGVFLSGFNGCFPGKRIPVFSLEKLGKGGYFPAPVFGMGILGHVGEEGGVGRGKGGAGR
ncbi:glutamine synthetase, partial [Escherichia coli]|nr:glutamine synthetase [Escherichia coli]